jgi:hypothetical protein
MADAPASGGATLYPDGGSNPAPAAVAIDPKTGTQVPLTATGGVPAGEAGAGSGGAETSKPAETAAEAPKPEEAKPAEAKPEEAKPGETPKIDPASYEIKLADGFTVDEPTLTEARQMFAELGVPKEGGQKLIDLYTKVAQKQAEQFASAAQTQFQETQQTWINELNKLPEFTGEARERNLGYLGRLMDEFGSPEANAVMATTGAGNNPAVVKYILSMGQALLEGEPTPPANPGSLAGPKGNGAQQRRSGGQILYGQKSN